MNQILFVPLNTNHVIIFNEILSYLKSTYVMVSHDRISVNEKYCTEELLIQKKIPYIHFDQKIQRSEGDNIVKELVSYFKIKKLIKKILDNQSPRVIVLAVDNDLISALFLKEAIKRNIKSVIIQEGSNRPGIIQYKINNLNVLAKGLLRSVFGIHLGYQLHGKLNLFDKYFVAGKLTGVTLVKRGVPSDKIVVTGQPKYDLFLKEAISHRNVEIENKKLLFAAGFHIIADQPNVDFLKSLINSTFDLGIRLIIKLHPRSSVSPEDIEIIFSDNSLKHCEIIKESDATVLALLKQVYGVITVSSTIVTEALIMNREGIVVDYLAGDYRLSFDGYEIEPVHHINSIEQVLNVLEKSINDRIPFEYKKPYLEDNIFNLDGISAKYASEQIENFCK